MNAPMLYILLTLAFFLPTKVYSYEEEDAVPLRVATQSDRGNIGKITVKLHNKNVEVQTKLTNKKNTKVQIGFNAHTDFFESLGIAEDHKNKTFSDLKVIFNEKELKTKAYRRGFFLGEDVTDKLARARVGPLPENISDTKVVKHRGLPMENWLGYVSYSWVNELGPLSSNTLSIRYQALPQFGLDDISSERFRYNVSRHCGEPDKVIASVTNKFPLLKYVYFERYEIPINFLRSHRVTLDVAQNSLKEAEIQPLIALACGISKKSGDLLNYFGEIDEPDKTISVFVISKFPGSIIEGHQ